MLKSDADLEKRVKRFLELCGANAVGEGVDSIIGIDLIDFMNKKLPEHGLFEVHQFELNDAGQAITSIKGLMVLLSATGSKHEIVCDVDQGDDLILFYFNKGELDYYVLKALSEKIGLVFGEVVLN